MQRPYQQFTSLIVVVAALALVGGVAIVLLTSGDSLSLAPDIWFGSASPQPTLAAPATATATPAAVGQATDAPTQAPVATQAPSTQTGLPTEAATQSALTETLPPVSQAVTAEVVLQGVAARLRDAPGGHVVGALLRGTLVEVLDGREVQDGVTWVEVRDPSGLTGWMAEDLLQIVEEPPPAATVTLTLVPASSLTPLPTLSGGVVGLATVALDSGTAGRLRDAPSGRVIGGIPNGTQVEVLPGREVRDGVTWIEVRDATGLTGWMSEDILDFPAP
jgi:hypothetical protein